MSTVSSWTFVTGGTLAPDATSYVERQADRDLLESLQNGETCYVLNSRQMGKSSLCVRTIGRLRAAGTRTAFLDLTKFGGRNLTAEQWYAALLSEVGRELGMRAEFVSYWKENANLPPVQGLFGGIIELGLSEISPLAIFVDEIDVTLSFPFSADEFFAAIRQCCVGRASELRLKQLTFCLLGTVPFASDFLAWFAPGTTPAPPSQAVPRESSALSSPMLPRQTYSFKTLTNRRLTSGVKLTSPVSICSKPSS